MDNDKSKTHTKLDIVVEEEENKNRAKKWGANKGEINLEFSSSPLVFIIRVLNTKISSRK